MNILSRLLPYAVALAAVLQPHVAASQDDGSGSRTFNMPHTGRSPAHGPIVYPGHPPIDQAHDAGSLLPADMPPPPRFTHYRVGQRNVKAMFAEDRIVWVGTSGGVIRYDIETDTHRVFDTKSGLLANGVFYLGRLNGRLAVGTYGGGLALLRPDMSGWSIYNVPEGLADAFVYDALQTSDGDIWIATWSGANRIVDGNLDDAKSWRTYTVENTGGGLPNDWVYALEEGPDGSIWMATEGGLSRFRDGNWSNWSHADGLGAPYEMVKAELQFSNDPATQSEHHARQKQEQGLEHVDMAYNPNYIVSLAVDSSGTIWCGTWGGGLARFENGEWTNYTVADGLPANHVFMLHAEPDGVLWIGTSNGLARMGERSLDVLSVRNGLFSNNVFSMDFAGDDSAWIGSYGGVTRFIDADRVK